MGREFLERRSRERHIGRFLKKWFLGLSSDTAELGPKPGDLGGRLLTRIDTRSYPGRPAKEPCLRINCSS